VGFVRVMSVPEPVPVDDEPRNPPEPRTYIAWLCEGCDTCDPPDGSPRQLSPCTDESPSLNGAEVMRADEARAWFAAGRAAERAATDELREKLRQAEEFAGNVIRFATGPVKPELWEDDSPLIEQAWAVAGKTTTARSSVPSDPKETTDGDA